MKLASLKHGRDGRLVVVSRDLTRATDAFTVVPTLQAALDDWDRLAPRLADLAEGLEHGAVPSFRFHEHDCAAPLPRAYACLAAAGQGGRLRHLPSHAASGPRDPARVPGEDGGVSFEQGLAAITGDIRPGPAGGADGASPLLLMLVNRISALNRSAKTGGEVSDEIPLQTAPAYSPICLTPDELGGAWRGASAAITLSVQINGRAVAPVDLGSADLAGALGTLRHAAAALPMAAGTILWHGAAAAGERPTLHVGDTIRVEAKDGAGHSLFGAIEQEVRPLG